MQNTFSSIRFFSSAIFLFIAISFFSFMPKTAYAFSGDGSGISEDPFLITTCVQLQEMNDALSAYYKLANNIDCNADTHSGGALWNSGDGFVPIGSDAGPSFTGNFNGDNKVISNVFINRPSTNSVGVFGLITGIIHDVGIEDVNVNGFAQVGGLVGRNEGTIANSYSTGAVSGTMYLGGLVGMNYYGGTITNSYSRVAVSGTMYLGGFVGINYGSISNSYSAGLVSGGQNGMGGLVGALNDGTITNSFWDIDTSGQATSAGSEVGKTTTEMTTQSTFSAWTFDATHWHDLDSNNGGYPYLSWQTFGGGGSSVPEFSTYLLFITIGTGFYLLQNKFAKA